MQFIADLHIHSKYSRATAQNLDIERISTSAMEKGVSVIATGDFTHPAWFSEIKEKLIPDGRGLFQLNKNIEKKTFTHVPPSCRSNIFFILSCEISNIYKKDNRVRKNHNLVFFPDLESVEKFNKKLEKIGNIHSDGRPILGLDAHDLLEMILEISASAFLIPAHIWTPWFSLFGSHSGFDSVEECFGDLKSHIFAVETGLSSDPEMNRRVSRLDGMTLVSNSDAHSPGKIAREANIFDSERAFSGIRTALENKKSGMFKGTLEFFPEEGKYHLDGHRKCGIRFKPEETRKKEGRCPICKKPLTRGVLHRIFELADRDEGISPDGDGTCRKMLPLTEILSEVFQVGPSSKKIARTQRKLVEKLGPELKILHEIPIETLDLLEIPLLGEAIRRTREENIIIEPGYDGQFGTLKIFNKEERQKILGQRGLFAVSGREKVIKQNNKEKSQRL